MGGASDGDLLETTLPKRVRLPAIGVCAEACDLRCEGSFASMGAGGCWLSASLCFERRPPVARFCSQYSSHFPPWDLHNFHPPRKATSP